MRCVSHQIPQTPDFVILPCSLITKIKDSPDDIQHKASYIPFPMHSIQRGTGGTLGLVVGFNFQAKIRIVPPSVSDTPHGIVHRGLMKNLTSKYKLHVLNL